MSEATFNSRFRDRMAGFGMVIYRVESHATSPGIPDNHFVIDGGSSGWIEMKQTKMRPAAINYRPKQAAWLYMYAMKGGKCWTLVHVKQSDSVIVVPGQCSLVAEKSLMAVQRFEFELSERKTGAWANLFSLFHKGRMD